MTAVKRIIASALVLATVLILCGCSQALDTKKDEVSDSKVVNVSDIDGLLDAMAPDTEIHLAPGTYNITEASNYGGADNNPYWHWNSFGYDGQYELCIENADGLSIIGDSAEIITVPRSSNVFVFNSCRALKLSGLIAGHTEEADACEAGVIRLNNCANTTIENCRLYGCGSIGIWSEGSSDLSVYGTDIYSCSTAGISFCDGMGLIADGCSIYDCGQSGPYMNAAGAFIFSNASDISVTNCDVHDNYLDALIGGFAANTSFDGITVRNNHMSSVFSFDGAIDFRGLSLSGNSVDRWTGGYTDGRISVDGSVLTEEDFSAMWGDQLSSAGIGETEAEYLTIDRSGAKEVHVKTADEFIAAIASDTTVYIDVPRIDITECSDYGDGASEEWRNPYYRGKTYAWLDCYDGYELYIGNVSNFHIVGGEIVTQPRYANVLNIQNCSGVTLEKVRLGHTPEQGECAGGVLFFDGSDDIIIENCDLYGCGILGVSTLNVTDIHVQNTVIHDCSYGAAQLEATDNAVFLGCSIENCPEPHFSLIECTNFSWDKKLMDPNSSFNVD